jgi:hypothetical protein
VGPEHAQAVNAATSTTTGFEGSPEVGPAHADAVNFNPGQTYVEASAYGGAPNGRSGFEGSPEVGPEHAFLTSFYGGWDVTHSQWELAVGVTNPFLGVPTYEEGTLGWGPGWLDFQISGFAGPGLGKKVEGTIRETPRTPGLSPEAKASLTYGIGKAEVSLNPDVVDGKVTGTVKGTLGTLSRTGEFQAYPDPQWNGWNRVSATPPKAPTAGLGGSAAAGARWSSPVVNLGDVARSAADSMFGTGQPAPSPGTGTP